MTTHIKSKYLKKEISFKSSLSLPSITLLDIKIFKNIIDMNISKQIFLLIFSLTQTFSRPFLNLGSHIVFSEVNLIPDHSKFSKWM